MSRPEQPAAGAAVRTPTARAPLGWFVAGALLVCLVLAGFVSSLASGSPDGLDSVTLNGCVLDADGEIVGGRCAAQQAEDPATAGSPLADYGLTGISGPLSTGLAGVIGVVVTIGVMYALARILSRRGRDVAGAEASAHVR